MVKNIKGAELKELIASEGDNLEIIDVREKEEYDLVKIKNSKLIPMGEMESRMREIDWSKKVVFICRSGARSGYIAEAINKTGKDVINLSGGVYELNLDDCECLEKSKDCCEGYF